MPPGGKNFYKHVEALRSNGKYISKQEEQEERFLAFLRGVYP